MIKLIVKIIKRNRRLYSFCLSIFMGINAFKDARKKYYKSKQAFILSGYPQQLRAMKNMHDGDRCFIIGNGPSLKKEDLESLTNEVTFSANSIYKIFDETEWRPTYYICQDVELLQRIFDIVWRIPSKKLFFPFLVDVRFPKRKKICRYYELFNPRGCNVPFFSEDISDKISNYFTVSYSMIQIAAYMGFKEIYLLGMDHKYSVARTSDGKVIHNNVKDHFGDRVLGSEENIPTIDNITNAFVAAKDYADSNGIKIFNATRGGYLEVFDRVNFDEIEKR